MKYEVQTKMLDTWENCWLDDLGNKTYFDSVREAQDEINDLLDSVKSSFRLGDMSEDYSREDYRVVAVADNDPMAIEQRLEIALLALRAAWQSRSEAQWSKEAPEAHKLIIAAIQLLEGE